MSTSNPHQPSIPLLQTCQTCFQAKIRCEKSQESEFCDRCVRLGKTCIFNPARRRRNIGRPRASLADSLEVRSRPRRSSKSPSSSQASAPESTPERPMEIFNKDALVDPFQRGILSQKAGEKLIDYFTKRMMPYFPFVAFPGVASIDELNRERPCACLAALAAASHAETRTQKALSTLFNQLVAARMVTGKFNDLDLLQGLLIHLAWAHYQPRPKRYTQHLLLTASIVSDMRLDRPRRPELWSVDGGKDRHEPDWGPDEMRALAGVYYLSSNSSIVLQKSRHFTYTPYISRCCEHLAQLDQHPTDKYLTHIIYLQTLVEKVDDVASGTSAADSDQFFSKVREITQKCADIKAKLPFSLSGSPPLQLQFYMLELLLSQASPRGTLFGLDKFRINLSGDQTTLINWLSASMSAARSLISMVLVLPHGEESAMSNMAWIMMHCGLSLAVRLDLLAARGNISVSAQHLRRFLDMPHTLRQIVLRLEAVTAAEPNNSTSDHQPFENLAKRVRRLEEWYLAWAGRQAIEPTIAGSLHGAEQSAMTTGTGTDNITVGDSVPVQNTWFGSFDWFRDPDLDIGNFLITDPVDFPGSFEL